MQRKVTTMLFSGALLAMVAAVAPQAKACTVPGMNTLKPAMILPPGLLTPRQASSTPAGSAPSIVGLWHVTFFSGGVVTDNAFDAWHSDGTEVLNDFTDPIEDNVCLGVWTQTSTGAYKLKHPSWTFDTGGIGPE